MIGCQIVVESGPTPDLSCGNHRRHRLPAAKEDSLAHPERGFSARFFHFYIKKNKISKIYAE